jgi:hypothetical protein
MAPNDNLPRLLPPNVARVFPDPLMVSHMAHATSMGGGQGKYVEHSRF